MIKIVGSTGYRWLYRKTGRLRQRLRCNRLTGHFFNRLPSEWCWLCRVGFPPKRQQIED